MGFVAAKCTQCGANIEVDNSNDAGICTYCNTAFITENVINNYTSYITNNIDIQNATITVTGIDINNLLLRASQFEQDSQNSKALDYYNRVLDVDAKNANALLGVERLSIYYIGDTGISKTDMDRIDALINRREKIQAIKLVRELTGLSLKEAKDYIDGNMGQTSSVNSSGSNSTGCYVATAVYGSYDCPEVWTLRRYRDYEMAETKVGRVCIYIYYAVSPTFVQLFGKTHWFKLLGKSRLDKFVRILQEKGYADTPYDDRAW